jgi:hypothetical protein
MLEDSETIEEKEAGAALCGNLSCIDYNAF